MGLWRGGREEEQGEGEWAGGQWALYKEPGAWVDTTDGCNDWLTPRVGWGGGVPGALQIEMVGGGWA